MSGSTVSYSSGPQSIPYTVDAEALRSVGEQSNEGSRSSFDALRPADPFEFVGSNPANAQSSVAPGDSAPRFRSDGPNAEAYGLADQYPTCKGRSYIQDNRCRVGAFSHFDTLFPARTIAASNEPSRLGRAAQEPVIRYTFARRGPHARTVSRPSPDHGFSDCQGGHDSCREVSIWTERCATSRFVLIGEDDRGALDRRRHR